MVQFSGSTIRIALGNYVGAMANCSAAMVKHHLTIAGAPQVEGGEAIPVDLACDILRHMLQAYRLGMAAFEANPEWAQYREGALLCKRNIESYLNENKAAWRTLFAQFLDQPEFLKIMATVDLSLFTSLTSVQTGSSSSGGEWPTDRAPGGKIKHESQRLLRLLFCLLDRGTGTSDETLLFDGMSHEQLVRTFTEYLNQHRHYIGYCHIEQSHALNDRGVDIILRAHGGKIGFQIKSHFDVRQEDFAANVKRQYTESFAHGLDHYIILICCPFRKEGKVDLQQKVSHLLNELSSMKTDYHSAYGPLNTVKYLMGLPTLGRDELLLRRAIASDAMREYEKGYEHLPEIDDEEIRRTQAHFESFGDEWWDESEGQEAFDRLNDVLKRKAAEQFTSRFLPTLPPEVKQRRAELISTAHALLAACRECKSWQERSEYKLPQWLDNVDEEMIPYTSIPNLLRIVQSLKRYLAVHKEMDAEMAQKESVEAGDILQLPDR